MSEEHQPEVARESAADYTAIRWMADTTPEAKELYFEIWWNMPPEKRLERCFEMTDQVRTMVRLGIKKRHPEYSEEQVNLAHIKLKLSEEEFQRNFPGVDIEP